MARMMRQVLNRCRTLPVFYESIVPVSPLEPAKDPDYGVMADYFDLCPEVVVLVSVVSRCVVTANLAFRRSVAPLACVAGRDVFDVLCPPIHHPRLLQAMEEVLTSKNGVSVPVDCDVFVWRQAKRKVVGYSWVLARHGAVLIMSGRPLRLEPGISSDKLSQLSGIPPPHSPLSLERVKSAPLPILVSDTVPGPPVVSPATAAPEPLPCAETLRQKDALLQKVFHEIRTPCHTLQMIARSLLEAVDPPAPTPIDDFKEQLETVWAQSVNICQLADDVDRLMALQDKKALAVTPRWFDLLPVLAEVGTFVEKLCSERGVAVMIEVAGEVPDDLQLFTDRELLRITLRHLVTAVVRGCDQGTARITVRMPEDDVVAFSVAAPGASLPPDFVQPVGREWFSRLSDASLCDPIDGHGLGVPLSFVYVHALGGDLQLLSSGGENLFRFGVSVVLPSASPGLHAAQTPRGTRAVKFDTFEKLPFSKSFYLSHSGDPDPDQEPDTPESSEPGSPTDGPDHMAPAPASRPPPATRSWGRRLRCLTPWLRARHRRHEPPSPASAPAPLLVNIPHDPSPRRPRLHVLVVEDNPICQRVVCDCLRRGSMTHAVAPNGRVACEMVAAAPRAYDVILMDLRMPVMDGVAATQYLRQTLGATMPIIVFSAESGAEVWDRVAAAGATDVLPKPATPRLVLEVIRRHCTPGRLSPAPLKEGV